MFILRVEFINLIVEGDSNQLKTTHIAGVSGEGACVYRRREGGGREMGKVEEVGIGWEDRKREGLEERGEEGEGRGRRKERKEKGIRREGRQRMAQLRPMKLLKQIMLKSTF